MWVDHPGLSRRFCFPCNQWLQPPAAPRHPPRRITLRLAPGALLTGDTPRVGYTVNVKTSDCRGAGTDGDVWVTIFGAKGDSGERALESSRNDFERGKEDSFWLEGADLGALTGLQVGWRVDLREVENLSVYCYIVDVVFYCILS